MSAPEPVQLLDVCPRPDGTAGIIVCTVTGERFALWPGNPPQKARPVHPGIARQAGPGGGVWAEHFPAEGCRLSDLTPPLDEIEAAELFARIADALSMLHAAAQAHGCLDANHIALSPNGSPILLGAGLLFAEPEDDLAQLVQLWETWCPAGALLDTRSASSLAEGLHTWLSVCGEPPAATLPDQIRRAQPEPMPNAAKLHLSWRAPEDAVDEVGLDLGPDESVRGLLDPLTWSGLSGEQTNELHREDTNEHTSSRIDEDTRINAPQAAVLARLLQAVHQSSPTTRFQARGGMPATAVLSLLEKEPLDILPSPEAYYLSAPAVDRLDWEDKTATAIIDPSPPSTTDFTPPPLVDAPPLRTPDNEISVSMLVVAIVTALLAGAAGVWLLLDTLN